MIVSIRTLTSIILSRKLILLPINQYAAYYAYNSQCTLLPFKTLRLLLRLLKFKYFSLTLKTLTNLNVSSLSCKIELDKSYLSSMSCVLILRFALINAGLLAWTGLPDLCASLTSTRKFKATTTIFLHLVLSTARSVRLHYLIIST